MNAYKTTALIFLALSTVSCATIWSKKTQKVHVYSNVKEGRLITNDSVIHQLPATIEVKRDKKDLHLTLATEEYKETYTIASQINPVFTFGNLLTIPAFGAGYLIDLTNKKRFSYKKHIFLGKFDEETDQTTRNAEEYIARHGITNDSVVETIYKREIQKTQNRQQKQIAYDDWSFKRFHPAKGTFYFNILTPSLYMIGISSENPNLSRFKNKAGGMSLGVALDYFYADKQFITLEIAHRSNVFDPFYFLDRYSYDLMVDKVNLSVMHSHRINRFNIGYGLSFDRVFYNYRVWKEHWIPNDLPYELYMSDDGKKQFSENYITLGFSGLLSYQWTQRLHIGVFYKPSVYSIRSGQSSFNYEHVTGLDIRLKF